MRIAVDSFPFMVGFFCISPVVLGHHSVAELDTRSVYEIEGEVTKLFWRNPHINLEITATADSGQEQVWRVEGPSIGHLERQGMTRESIGVGARIKVAGNRSTRRNYVLNGTNVLLPSGAELLLLMGVQPRWSETFIGGRDWIPDAPEGSITVNQGIFRVWSWDRSQAYMPGFAGGDGLPLTDSAAGAASEWDILEDPTVFQCTPWGMPMLMSNPYPIEFVDLGEDIELRMELFDQIRVIHMNERENAEGQSASPLGYSVGH